MPIWRNAAFGARNRLTARMRVGWRELRARPERFRTVIVDPILAWFVASDDRVFRFVEMPGRMLVRRVVAATDMSAFGAPSKV